MEGSKDLTAMASPWYFDFCFLAVSIHRCNFSLVQDGVVKRDIYMETFAAFSRTYSEPHFPFPFDTG